MSKQSGVSPEILPLPSGGGATRSIGETFAPDLHTGTGNYRIPLWFPRGCGKFQPDMNIVYSTGGGNGPFGMGWHMPVMKISRRTDRGLPTYDDEQDTFLLDGEEIIPLGGGRYRHQREIHFRRIDRSGDGWEIRDKGGRCFILGTTPGSRIEETAAGATRTLAWLIEKAIDTNGNEINYHYRRDRGQLYLETIVYSIYTIRFNYESRPDTTVNRRAGFDITTGLRCISIEYNIVGDPAPLFRRYTFTYDECPHTRLSLLASAGLGGYSADGDTAELPVLRFTYTPFQPGKQYQPFSSEVDEPPPLSVEDINFDLVDLYSSGLPGVIELSGSSHRFWPNKGHGRWGAPRHLRQIPAPVSLSGSAAALADMDGNGTADLITLSELPLGYYINEAGQGWTHRSRFRRAPAFDPDDPEVRLLDLNGDGVVDAIRSSQRMFYLYFNKGDEGWDSPVAVTRIHDMSRFPDVFFSDPRVKLADMTGDGLIDIVLVHGGRIDYWPHYGNGRFGSRITLALQPAMGLHFDPNRLFLSDINGDGLADIVYVESDRVRLWVNQGGNALVSAGVIHRTPQTTGNNIRLADMYGTGTLGLLWSYNLSRREQRNYKYMDFTGGVRPYLLASVDSGIGLITEIEYKPSTEHLLEAQAEGRPWESTLPFPVQTVSRITQRDTVSGTTLTRGIRYFDGYFDGRERAFRGFGRVEVLEEGDAETPSTLTVSYFHQGRRRVTPGETDELRQALTGQLYRLAIFSPDGSAEASQPFRVEENTFQARLLETGINHRPAIFPHLVESVVNVYERDAVPLVDRTRLVYDDFGNVIQKHEYWDSDHETRELISDMAYTVDTGTWILNLPVELIRRDKSGRLLSLRRFYYDGDPFVGLPLGQVVKGNLRRREDMIITDDVVNTVFGAVPPDYASLGYHRMTSSPGDPGWGVNGLRQRHDAHGNVIGKMDPFGQVGQIIYDTNGIYPTQIIDPLSNSFNVTYDLRSGEIARLAEPNGHQTQYFFDAIGRLVKVIKPGDSDTFPTTEFEHLDSALPLGVHTRLRGQPGSPDTLDDVEYFDGFQRTIQRRSSAESGQVIVDGWRRYNSRGWEKERTSPFFSTGFNYVPDEGNSSDIKFHFKYDALGRIVETVTPDDRLTRVAYHKGTVTRWDVLDLDDSPENIALGHFDTPRLEKYDVRGRLLLITEQNTGGTSLTTKYTRDSIGHLLAIIDARHVQTATYTYDLTGRKIQVEHIDAGRRRVVHNARGDVAISIDAKGQRTEISYDSIGRKTETQVDGIVLENYEYDTGSGSNLIGRLARVRDEAGEVHFSYNPRGLIEEKTRQVQTLDGPTNYILQYEYDSMERMIRVIHPGGAPVNYHYNDRGLLNRIEGYIDDITYNALGQRTWISYSNGVEENQTFDDHTFFLDEALINGPARPTPYYHMSYTYDAVGNPQTITDGVSAPDHPRFQRQFSYDALYRITGVKGELNSAAFSYDYNYDDAGNFRKNEEFRPEELYLAPGGTNQVLGIHVGATETQLFDYDANGNLVSTPDMTLEFDARSRLTRVTRTDGTVIEQNYGYTGELIRKRISREGVTKETIYIERLFEVREAQAIRFIFNEDVRVAAVMEGSGTYFFHHDHLGNTVLITDESGGIAGEFGYFPFGTAAFSTGTDQTPYRFIGNELDSETGLVYCGSRYFDPHLGRFISPDLFILLNPEETLGLPANLNLYVYAMNNPMRLVDDEGAWWKWLLGALIIAALVVATIIVGVATGGAGFAFGILLAASIGSALGSGIGVYSAWQGGGDLADGFLFGALVGGAAGAAGYALGAAVGAAGISGVWGSILAGAAEGAIIGAGNGAIIGYAGGAGSWEDILIQVSIGFGIGAVLGGLAGYVSHKFPLLSSNTFEEALGQGTARATDPQTGQILSQTYETGLAPAGSYLDRTVTPVLNRIIAATAQPMLYTGLGSVSHLIFRYHWDDIKAWMIDTFGGDDEEVIISTPETEI